MEELQKEKRNLFLWLSHVGLFLFSLRGTDENPKEYLAWSSLGKIILPAGWFRRDQEVRHVKYKGVLEDLKKNLYTVLAS